MSGLVERRNDPGHWGARQPRFVRLRNKHLPVCDDCVINAHEHAGRGGIERARWRRWLVDSDPVVQLCDVHKRQWETWTPGQIEMTP